MARQVMNAEEIRRALTRISHEIIEKEGTEGLVVVGIQRRGVPLAKVIVEEIKEQEGVTVE
jgi:pyrimidine operon attenuation protein/uracil phosphoribosyltransferase